MEKPYDQNMWFSPRYAIQYLWRKLRVNGDNVLMSTKYQKEREAWIMGITLLGVMKLLRVKWWLQVPKDDPPDMLAMTVVPNQIQNINEMHFREIEIMQITKFTSDSIVNEIERKLKNKAYMKKTGLVVYLNRSVLIEDMRTLSKEMKMRHVNIADIWIVACISENSQEYTLFSLIPHVQRTDFNFIDEMNSLEAGDMIEMTKSKGIKMELERNVPVTKFIP